MSTYRNKALDLSFEKGMTEPLLRRGSELPGRMTDSRSSSFKAMMIKLLDYEPSGDSHRLQRTSAHQALSYIFP